MKFEEIEVSLLTSEGPFISLQNGGIKNLPFIFNEGR